MSPFIPVTVADILDQSISIYRNNFKILFTVNAVGYIPYMLFVIVYLAFLYFGYDRELIWIFLAVTCLFMLPLWIIMLNISQAMSISIISDIIFNRPASIYGTLTELVRTKKLFKFILTMLIYGLIVFFLSIPFIILFIAFIYFKDASLKVLFLVIFLFLFFIFMSLLTVLLFLYNFIGPAVILEDHAFFQSFRRSVILITKDPLKAIAVPFLSGMLVQVIQGAFSVPFAFLSLYMTYSHPVIQFLIQLVPQFFAIILVPLLFACNTLVYYNIRFRKEGYDLELMAYETFKH
jgi:hypothetical protein